MKKFKNSKAHEAEHFRLSRRNFLSTVGLAGAGSMVLGNLNITGLQANPLAAVLNNANSDRILVLIRLSGGNDGLNTIIPLNQYGVYANKRPTIKIAENEITSLEDSFGIPDFMDNLLPFWNDGNMSVIHGVGYNNQDLSHFRSTDIWHSASDANVEDNTGWLGRFLGNEYPDFLLNPPVAPPAVQIGSSSTFMANLNSNAVDLGFSVSDPVQMAAIAENGQLYNINDVPDCYYGNQLQYLRTVTNTTFQYTDAIYEAYQAAENSVEYSDNELSEQLALVARFIKGNLGSKIYMVNLRGFDTHDAQAETHQELLMNLSTAVNEFYEDLGSQQSQVLSMAYSEFGRRIEENASLGTDHGAAAPILLFGGALNTTNQQSFGEIPDLQAPDITGSLQYNVDFRSVYATLLENWLCVPAEIVNNVMNANFERIENLVPNCAESPTSNEPSVAVNFSSIEHSVSVDGRNAILKIKLTEAQNLDITIFDISGKQIGSLFSGFIAAGEHKFTFSPREMRIANGAYLYRITAKNKVVGGKLMGFGR